MQNLPLFDEDPGDFLQVAFDRWLADQRDSGLLRRGSSSAVYRSMWGSFAAWCLTQSPVVTLASLDRQDLAVFQAARFGMKSPDLTLSPRHALRLLRLIDRVLQHHAASTGKPVNTAAADWIAAQPQVRFAASALADPLPAALSASEAKNLIVFLRQVHARPSLQPPEAAQRLNWQEVRNRVAVALQLGAGLTPGDVRVLLTSSLTCEGGRVLGRPWKVAVPGNGNVPAHEAPIAPWAGELLQHWLHVREQSRIAGDFLFPSTRSGKPWSKEAQYKAARQVCEDAALEDQEGGSFRLRHTFALRQLRRGTAPEQVARWLGLESEAMDRYLRVVPAPQGVI